MQFRQRAAGCVMANPGRQKRGVGAAYASAELSLTEGQYVYTRCQLVNPDLCRRTLACALVCGMMVVAQSLSQLKRQGPGQFHYGFLLALTWLFSGARRRNLPSARGCASLWWLLRKRGVS